MFAAEFYLPVQELSGQKLTYAQIMKKKQEKEAAERAAQEAEESHAEGGVKGKAEDKVTPAPVQEVEVKKEEAGGVSAPPGPGKGRLSKTNSGPSSGDKDKKVGGSANNNNNSKAANKRTERPKSPVGGGPAK